jgi:cyclopropane-fatty-acyl-phospholipid synthase
MNPSLLLPNTDRRTASLAGADFYQRQVIRALEKMTAGFLRLELPNGAVKLIGHPGNAVQATIRVLDPVFFRRCVLFGDVGFGESYVDGEWETDSIERVIRLL